MNEKIRELARQAGGIDMTNNIASVTTWIGTGSSEFLEKFAELIVRECALIAGLMEHEGRKNIGATILDRFEVKE